MSAGNWAEDLRWQQAQRHAQRDEVVQAELLLRSLLKDHADCLPALTVLAGFAADRADWELARSWLLTAQVHAPADADLAFDLAQTELQTGRLPQALDQASLATRLRPDHHVAWLVKAQACEALGDSFGALRARYQAITRAQRAGKWTGPDAIEPGLEEFVAANLQHLKLTRREYLMSSFDEVRKAVGAAALGRVERALTGYLGEWNALPSDPRQRPKFLYFPDLPAGPYHDPMLQPWAHTLRDAWPAMRAEAMALLQRDQDFESFLGLKSGTNATQYVAGENPNAAWDAFFFYRHGERYDEHHSRCPQTSAVLEAIDLCRVRNQAPEVCFSVLRPQSTIVRHYGVTNTRLVMHLPLIVPPGCALNIIDAGEHHWREGEMMMFDDTFQHEAWNPSPLPRLILLMDCWNPHLTAAEQYAVKQLVEAIDALENA